MKTKKFLIPLIILLIIGLGVGGFFFFKSQKSKTTKAPAETRIKEQVNVIDISARPYVSLTPRNDLREVSLTIHDIKQPADEAEYELEYQAGSLLQGVFGTIDLSGSLPITKDLLLGSCSAGGACTYHEDVKGGNLTMLFSGDENYAIKVEWNFIPTSDAKGKFSSKDAKFQLNAAKLLNSSSVVIIMQTSGLPEAAEGQVLSGPYGLYPSQSLPKGKAELTMRLSQEAESATIMGWNGTKWVEFNTTLEGKSATATVDLLSVYIAVAE